MGLSRYSSSRAGTSPGTASMAFSMSKTKS
jgi:hypothetical protein